MSFEGKVAAPRQLSDVTPGWLTQALGERFPGTVVSSLHVGTQINGTATKTRLLLSYNEAGHKHDLPPTMWLKSGFEEHSDATDLLAVYAAEAHFYSEIASQLDNNIPQAYAAGIDADGSGRSFILLEDLLARNALFRTAIDAIDAETATHLISELAMVHARTWDNEELKSKPWLQNGGSLLPSCDVMMSPMNWKRSQSLPRAQFVRGPLSDFETMRRSILMVLNSDVQNATCMVHGDSHIGNAFFPVGSRPGFLDWQSPFYGMWAHDIAYFIVTGLSIEDRRHHERQLIAHYVSEMAAHGRPLSFDDAWLEYRRHALYSTSWSMCLPEWQAEERCCAVAEKAFAAVKDLDTLDVW